MREIKFRGKRVYCGDWVYGSYFYDGKRHYIITDIVDKEHAIYGHYSNKVNLYIVDPETVGQYTGIKDDNDKKIYKDDIIRIRESEFDDWEVYQVKYHGHRDYPAFDTEPTIDCDCNGISYATACCNIEKIGNIFDNPELLEVEQ